MTKLSTTMLAELISKRRSCFVQLRDLGLKQAELIAAGNLAELMRLLAAKQQLIIALQALEQGLAPFHEQDPDSREWSSAAARERCAADAAQCRELIEEVMAMEQAGEREMTSRRDELAHQLRSVSAAGRVREAYQAQSAPLSGVLRSNS